MAGPLRIEFSGALYPVASGGNAKNHAGSPEQALNESTYFRNAILGPFRIWKQRELSINFEPRYISNHREDIPQWIR
jgi:hypothetical protein